MKGPEIEPATSSLSHIFPPLMVNDWLISMLVFYQNLRLVEENIIAVFCHCSVHYTTKMSFHRKNNVVIFPIYFQIFMLLTNLYFIRHQRQFSIISTRPLLAHPPSEVFGTYYKENPHSGNPFGPLLQQASTAAGNEYNYYQIDNENLIIGWK